MKRGSHSALCAKRAGEPCSCGLDKQRRALEDQLEAQLADLGIDDGFRRDVAYLPGRGFRGDFVWEQQRLVVEVQGWRASFGPHGGIAKAKADVEKHALSAAHGWRVLPVTRDTIQSGEAARLILAALAWSPAP